MSFTPRSNISSTPRGSGPSFGQSYTRMRKNSTGGSDHIQQSFGAVQKKANAMRQINTSQTRSDIMFTQPGKEKVRMRDNYHQRVQQENNEEKDKKLMGRLSKRINGGPAVSLRIGHEKETIKIKPGKKLLGKADSDPFNLNKSSTVAMTPRSQANIARSRNTVLDQSKTVNPNEKTPTKGHTQTMRPTTGGTNNMLAMYMAKSEFQSLRELKEKAQTKRYKEQCVKNKSNVFASHDVLPGDKEKNRSASKQRFLNGKICRPKDSMMDCISYKGNESVQYKGLTNSKNTSFETLKNYHQNQVKPHTNRGAMIYASNVF